VENGYSENHVIEHRLKDYKPLLEQLLNIPERLENSFLY